MDRAVPKTARESTPLWIPSTPGPRHNNHLGAPTQYRHGNLNLLSAGSESLAQLLPFLFQLLPEARAARVKLVCSFRSAGNQGLPAR